MIYTFFFFSLPLSFFLYVLICSDMFYILSSILFKNREEGKEGRKKRKKGKKEKKKEGISDRTSILKCFFPL